MTESVPYEVLESFDAVEVRRYPAIAAATVRGLPDEMAFRLLFRYISGENRVRRDIAMTVPVLSSGPTYRRISMTRPVLSDEGSFSFVLPPSMPMDAVPEPLNERVVVEKVPARKLAVLRFPGRVTEDSVRGREQALMAALERKGIRARGRPFLMRYNGPGTPGFLRRNEVAVEIEG